MRADKTNKNKKKTVLATALPSVPSLLPLLLEGKVHATVPPARHTFDSERAWQGTDWEELQQNHTLLPALGLSDDLMAASR